MPYFFNNRLCKPPIIILEPIFASFSAKTFLLTGLFLPNFLPQSCLILYSTCPPALDPSFGDNFVEPDWVLQVSPIKAVVFNVSIRHFSPI